MSSSFKFPGSGHGSTDGLRRGAWTHEEDVLLKRAIEKYGEGNWHLVPVRAGLARCRKSCRLRWLNYLKPGLKRGEFGDDELDLIIRLHRLLGNRWALIAGRIPGRTANDIKNYWNSHLSKRVTMTLPFRFNSGQAHSKSTSRKIGPIKTGIEKKRRKKRKTMNADEKKKMRGTKKGKAAAPANTAATTTTTVGCKCNGETIIKPQALTLSPNYQFKSVPRMASGAGPDASSDAPGTGGGVGLEEPWWASLEHGGSEEGECSLPSAGCGKGDGGQEGVVEGELEWADYCLDTETLWRLISN